MALAARRLQAIEKRHSQEDGDEADPLTLDQVEKKQEEVGKKSDIVAILAKTLGEQAVSTHTDMADID